MEEVGIEGKMEEMVKKVLKAMDVEDVGKLSRAGCVRALGRLMAIKVREDSPSRYELTKEVRKALRIVLRSPLGRNVDDAIQTAVFMDAPFESQVLNSVYRLLLESLLKKTVEEVKEYPPLWKVRLLNLMTENIYNIVMVEGYEYRDKVLKALKEGGAS